ncbi:MAG TPA: DUF2155 domain-containing protein [Paracoccaceae bacterium]|jgi:hypothetical protein|nr:DUF2155 domain-containing protein [Paracoccaceae bacterium]
MRWLLIAAALLPLAAAAQEFDPRYPAPLEGDGGIPADESIEGMDGLQTPEPDPLADPPPPAQSSRAQAAPGAVVRWLDKVSGETGDVDLQVGQAAERGRLTIALDDCRYPGDGQPTEAFAHLTIRDSLVADPVFSGWMVAEAPALNAMDHGRYDVWVLRCLTE